MSSTAIQLIIQSREIKVNQLSQSLGRSPQWLEDILSGDRQLTLSELRDLIRILSLTEDEIRIILL